MAAFDALVIESSVVTSITPQRDPSQKCEVGQEGGDSRKPDALKTDKRSPEFVKHCVPMRPADRAALLP